jgi:signal transduction histidine kinase/CheY-like chemotaxis protein
MDLVNKRHIIALSGLIIIVLIFECSLNFSTEKRIICENKYKILKINSGSETGLLTLSREKSEYDAGIFSQESLFIQEAGIWLLDKSNGAGKDIAKKLTILKYINRYQDEIFSVPGYKTAVIVLSGLVIILLCSLLWWCIYKIHLKKLYSELSLKEKILSDTKEEYQATLNRIQKINSDLVEAKEKAEEADKLKTAFLANMSHEIRTPMNAIIGLSSFLTEPGLSKEKTEDFVEIINSSSQQLLTIIDDIVDISKIEAGQVSIVSESVNINKLLKEIYVIYLKPAESKKIGLSFSCEQPDDLIQTMTDKNRVKQVFCNLLNNAIKFTGEGEIEFGYTIKEKFVEFYVKDNGIGIASENRSFIFDRFRQVGTLDSRMYGGIGLGLSISKGLVEKMGGTIWVNSELGKGSTFYFTIPYIEGNNTAGIPYKSIKSPAYTNWENKTILIVEDDMNNYTYIEKILLLTNIKILHAWNGMEAIELLKNHSEISLVLMDFKMPVLDGYEATRLIKEFRPELPIIAQTAYAFSNDKTKAFDAGCNDYLSKPFQKDIIIEAIGKYLEKKT